MSLLRKIAAVGLAVLLCGGLGVSAEAVQSGSVLVIQQKDGEAIPGGSLTLYRVGEAGRTVTLTENFASSHVVIEDIHSPDAAQALADFAAAQKIAGTIRDISREGTASFSGLEEGVYLIVQHKAADGYLACSPFLISIPMLEDGTASYSVIVRPKVAPDTPQQTQPETTAPEETPLPQTGDERPLLLWLAALALSAMGISVLLYRRFKKRS